LASQPWYRANLNVAQGATSDITTGALGGGAYPAALGGPAKGPAEVGPFATLAEAERMRHEMEGRGTVVIKNRRAGSDLSYYVRPDAPDDAER